MTGDRGLEAAFRVAYVTATLIMLGLSWPLWVEPSALPRVPFFAGLPTSTPAVSWALFLGILGLLAASVLGDWPRRTLAASAVLLAGLILQDQHRFQPWAYQAIVMALALSIAGRGGGLSLCRAFLIGLYLHSGLSKLDVSFLRELGPAFLGAGGRLLGLDPAGLPGWARTALILAMPAAEIAVAVGLSFRKTRRVGMIGAVLIHAILIALLGPWALRQSTIVLVWNLSVMAQVAILFGPPSTPRSDTPIPAQPAAFRAAAVAIGILLVLPFVERLGWFDSWPSFALYASHAERLEVRIAVTDEEELGTSASSCLFPIPGTPWKRLDLTAWSRSVRGTPAYPQNRANVGLALGVLGRPGRPITFRAILQGRAHPISGRRDAEEIDTFADLESRAGRYRLNARPAPEPRDR
ncbi:MAG: hypothetical protein U0800_02240 [Isosphaeraceae bacterium]